MFSMEYVITRGDKYGALAGNHIQWVAFAFASVFTSKGRAGKLADKNGGKVEPFYGKPIAGTKNVVVPKQRKDQK